MDGLFRFKGVQRDFAYNVVNSLEREQQKDNSVVCNRALALCPVMVQACLLDWSPSRDLLAERGVVVSMGEPWQLIPMHLAEVEEASWSKAHPWVMGAAF